MSLDTVVEDIRDEARARAREIEREGERRAEAILEEAETEAKEILETAESEVETEAERQRKQKLSAAKLEAKQTRLEARRDVLEDVHERVEQRLADLGGERREELTRALVDAAAPEFDDSETVSVHGRPEDHDLLERILTDYDGFEVVGERDCLGGVVVEGDRSRVRVNNTFDSILEDVWEDELRAVSERLFDT